MRLLACALLAAALPFWETRPAADWSDAELEELLTNSPWAQQAVAAKTSTGAQTYLATALPMRVAEEERERRAKKPPCAAEDDTAGEYAEFLRANEGKVIVLAVELAHTKALDDPAELRRMEDSCVLTIGKRKYRLTGHFPPSASDPWLRLVFPREIKPQDDTLHFGLYIPTAVEPYRFAVFRLKELRYKGRLEL